MARVIVSPITVDAIWLPHELSTSPPREPHRPAQQDSPFTAPNQPYTGSEPHSDIPRRRAGRVSPEGQMGSPGHSKRESLPPHPKVGRFESPPRTPRPAAVQPRSPRSRDSQKSPRSPRRRGSQDVIISNSQVLLCYDIVKDVRHLLASPGVLQLPFPFAFLSSID